MEVTEHRMNVSGVKYIALASDEVPTTRVA